MAKINNEKENFFQCVIIKARAITKEPCDYQYKFKEITK